jgi:hypothetical protein
MGIRTSGVVGLTTLPTSDPGVFGQLWQDSGVSPLYTTTFTDSTLVTGVLTITQPFDGAIQASQVVIEDNGGNPVLPDNIDISYSAPNAVIAIDLTEQGTLTGTWVVRVMTGGAGRGMLRASRTHALEYTAGDGGTLTGVASQRVIDGLDGTQVVAVNGSKEFSAWSDAVATAARTDLHIHAPLAVTANFAYAATMKLLLHMEGDEDGTVFTDSSPIPLTVTRPTSSYLKTVVAGAKFGSRGMLCGSNDAAIGIYVAGTDIPLATSDFTMSMWVKRTTALGGNKVFGWQQYGNIAFLSAYEVANTVPVFNIGQTGAGAMNIYGPGGVYILNDSNWYHVLLTRYGLTMGLAINGVFGATASFPYPHVTTLNGTNTPIYFGGAPFGFPHGGYIDEVRFDLGVSLNHPGDNFTPPTTPY